MDPLVATVLLGFGLLLAACLTLWMALTLPQRVAAEEGEEGEASEVDDAPAPSRPTVSNDEVRGARAGRLWSAVRPPPAAPDAVPAAEVVRPAANGADAEASPEAGADPGPAGRNGSPREERRPPSEAPRSGDDPFERFLRDRSPRDDLDF